MAHVIGIDFGTESVRAFVFDLRGRPVASEATRYPTRFPEPSWAEQDPEDWWRAVGKSVRGALAAAGVPPSDIIALAADTTCCSVVALDRAMKPLRPALIWMDVRSAEEAAAVAASGDPALRVNGAGAGPVSAEWMIPKALWIRRHEPELYDRAAAICEFQDYINWRLTGRYVGALTNMAVRWHYQTGHGGRPISLLERLGIADLAAKWPAEVLAPGDPVGKLTSEAADHLGLPAGLLVAQGGSDAEIGVIGLGVIEPGQLALITGSSHLHLGIAGGEFHKPGVWGTYADAIYPGRHLVEGGQTSTGSVVNWFKTHFAAETSYDALDQAAARLPPGAEGLLALDHFQGNRTPYTDAASRGALTGLTLKHTPAHVFRAIMESVCFGTRLILESMNGPEFRIDRITVAGGATNSPLWLQLHADIAGLPLTLTEVPDAPALGAAIFAAVAAGAHRSIDEGVAAMVRRTRVIEPDPASHDAYEPIFAQYRELYQALKRVRESA